MFGPCHSACRIHVVLRHVLGDIRQKCREAPKFCKNRNFDSRYTRVRALSLFVLHRFHSLGHYPIAEFTRSCLKCRRRVFLWSQRHSVPWPLSPPTINCLTKCYKSRFKPVFSLDTDLEFQSGGRVCFYAQICNCTGFLPFAWSSWWLSVFIGL